MTTSYIADGRPTRRMRNDSMATLMLVEDDPDLADALSELLRQEGYEVLVANNGEEALERLKTTTPPAVILLDLMMPKMNGWDFRAAQQEDPELLKIPTILISAGTGIARAAGALGLRDYAQKPLDLDTLLALIRVHLPEESKAEA